MISIYEYLLGKNKKLNTIHAKNDNIRQIVKDELNKLGNDADLNHIDTSDVTNMSWLFSGHEYMNPDISDWNVENVTNTSYMFHGCRNFNCDISNWDVYNVEYMEAMFAGCEKFNQDISGWNVNKVNYVDNIFVNCSIKEDYKPKFK